MRLGLNYFGDTYDYVPLVSLTFYMSALDSLFDSGSALEQAFREYQKADALQSALLGNLKLSTDQAARLLEYLSDENGRLVTRQTDCEKNARALFDQIARLWIELDRARKQFIDAVNRQSGKCNFGQLLKIAAAVGTVVATGGTTIAAVSAAWSAMSADSLKGKDGKPIEGDWSKLKYRVDQVQPALTSGQSFVDAYEKLKTSLDVPHPDFKDLPADTVKIIADRDAYQIEINKYRNLSEAGPYQRALDAYIDICTRRNNALIELNGVQLRRAAIGQQIALTSERSAELQAGISKSSNPYTSAYKEFFWDAKASVAASATKNIYLGYRALSLLRGENVDYNIDDRDIAALKLAKGDLVSRLSDTKTAYAKDADAFRAIKVNIFDYAPASEIARFRKTGEITFSIPTTIALLKDKALVMAQAIQLDKASVPPPFEARFIHHGGSLVRARSGRFASFSHEPLIIPHAIADDGTTIFDGRIKKDAGSDYVGVSPFAVWSLIVTGKSASFLKSLKALRIVIDGQCYQQLDG